VFDQQIERARAQRRQQRRKLLLATVIIALLCVAIGLIYIAVQRQLIAPQAPISPSTLSITATPEENAAARKLFQQQWLTFEQERSPLLNNPDFLRWLAAGDSSITVMDTILTGEKLTGEKITQKTITEKKDKALVLFANSAYTDAITTLQHASDIVVAIEQAWHRAYEDKLAQAQQAYEEDKVKPAQLYLNQAIKIKSEEPSALSLQQQLTSYPNIAKLLRALNIAKMENNLQKQADSLQQIIAQDATRIALVEELKRVTRTLNERSFSQAITEGLAAIEQQQLRKANTAYQRAKTIYRQRPELKTLQKKIAQQQTSVNLKTLLTRLQQAAQADDWREVLAITQTTRLNNTTIKTYQQNAQTILRLQQIANNYLTRAERLQDKNIRQQAQKFVTDNFAMALKSPNFAKQIEQLSEKLSVVGSQQKLHISSDGKTDIWVLGVGHVGQIVEKEILLYPGKYIVEGRCPGYRNNQLSITLSASIVANIHVVCDERI
jgi:hypothetical protein